MITIYLLQYLTSDLINKIKQLGAKFCCLHMQLELIFFLKTFKFFLLHTCICLGI